MNSIARIGIKLMGIYLFVLALKTVFTSITIMSAYQPLVTLTNAIGPKSINPWVYVWMLLISFDLCVLFISYLLIFRDEFILKVMRFPKEDTSTSIDVHGAVVVGIVLIGLYCFITGASEFTKSIFNIFNQKLFTQLVSEQVSSLSLYLGLVSSVTKLIIAACFIFFPNGIARKLDKWRTKKVVPQED